MVHEVIEAAGGIVWRRGAFGREVLAVHRPRYNDWTLPKGKREPGESWAETAVREVEEEASCKVRITGFASCVSYPVRDRIKLVLFWNMEVVEDRPFVANEEVDQRAWLTVEQALSKLHYENERALLKATEP